MFDELSVETGFKPVSAFTYDNPIPHFTWPPLPNAKAARNLAVLNYLEQSQWFPCEKIRAKQFEQLQLLFKHSSQHVPCYRDKHYAKFFNEENSTQLKENWQNIPILTRSQIQQNSENLKSQFLPPEHGEPKASTTSGSTAKPITIYLDVLSQFFWNSFLLRHFFWHRFDFSKKMAIIHYAPEAKPPAGRKLSSWGSGTPGIITTGECYDLGLCDVQTQLDWILKIKPDYLICYPTILRSLLELMPKKPAELANLQFIGTFSEIVDLSLRQEIKNKLNVPLVDLYSNTELGPIASQCPASENYHVNEENIFIEILNERGEICKPGEIGRIVVTGLHNFAMPLIRYESGDYAEVGEPCTCGRGLMTLKRILGRQRNMITLPNGEKRWPVFGVSKEANLLTLLKYNQFQIIQRTLYDIEVSVVYPEGKLPEVEIIPILQKIFGYPFNFTFNYVDNILRSANGKYEDFKSEIA